MGDAGRSDRLWRLIDAKKDGTRILSSVKRHLELEQQRVGRDATMLHSSEMSRADWCPRHDYYRIIEGEYPPEDIAFGLRNVFDEGHDIHDKWQNRLWRMGTLRGVYECVLCSYIPGNEDKARWEATAPQECPQGHPREFLRYREVPLRDEEHHIIGHADGDIDDDGPPALLEVKSVGQGTVRYDAPELISAHTKRVYDADGNEASYVDWEALWRSLKRPMLPHLLQTNLYMHMKGYKLCIFIYECKWNQQVKEFRIRYSPRLIEDLLDGAKDVTYALKTGKPPVRPGWATKRDKTCKACPFFGPCWGQGDNGNDTTTSRAQQEPEARASEARSRRPAHPGRTGSRPRTAAKLRDTPTEDPVRPSRQGRRVPDRAVRDPDPLGGLFGGSGDSGRDRRRQRRPRP